MSPRPLQLSKYRGLLLPGLATLLVAASLIGLGVWQLHRLAWKEQLIADIAARSAAAPLPLPPRSQWDALANEASEFRHVVVRGAFDNKAETLILRASEDGPGYHVVTPFHLDGGGTILIDRGFVPAAKAGQTERLAGQSSVNQTIIGVIRAPEHRNLFTPPDDLQKGEFYTRDPGAITAFHHLVDAAPFSIDADPAMLNPGGWPKPVAIGINLPNNHFGYALTWFGLAIGLIGVFIAYAWSQMSGRAALEAEPERHAILANSHRP